jgi:hypothetical protein
MPMWRSLTCRMSERHPLNFGAGDTVWEHISASFFKRRPYQTAASKMLKAPFPRCDLGQRNIHVESARQYISAF